MTEEQDSRPILNEKLLRAAVDYIEAHPDEWDQSVFWGEGSGRRCLAAMALALHYNTFSLDDMEEKLKGRCGEECGDRCLGFDYHCAVEARKELGLTKRESYELFYWGSMTHDISKFKQHITFVTGVEFK